MTKNQNGEENRRGFLTLVDPKTLPTIIPLILAVASAFMVHDRAINTMKTQISNIETQEERQVKNIDNILAEISELKARVRELSVKLLGVVQSSEKDLKGENVQLERLEKELVAVRQRLRDLEREVDRQLGPTNK